MRSDCVKPFILTCVLLISTSGGNLYVFLYMAASISDPAGPVRLRPADPMYVSRSFFTRCCDEKSLCGGSEPPVLFTVFVSAMFSSWLRSWDHYTHTKECGYTHTEIKRVVRV